MKTDVVLLPGLHGTTALFDTFIRLAPAWARCRAVPLPAEGPQDFDTLAQTLYQSLRSLEGIVLVAESFSGPIAARLSRLLTTKVALLVLCNPLVEASLVIPPRLAVSLLSLRFLPAWSVGLLMAGGSSTLGTAILHEVRSLPNDTLLKRIEVAQWSGPRDLVDHAHPPLLAIISNADFLVAASSRNAALSSIPFTTIAELQGPHLIIQARPTEVWTAISSEFASAA